MRRTLPYSAGRRGLALVFSALALGLTTIGCEEPIPSQYESARIEIIDAIDPDLSDPSRPLPGVVVWVCTYSGRAQIFVNGAPPGDDRIFAIGGGEVIVTTIAPDDLYDGDNPIEIRVRPNDGGRDIIQIVTLVKR